MIEQSVSLASNGVVKVPGYEQLARAYYDALDAEDKASAEEITL